jgi:hypothetical protein
MSANVFGGGCNSSSTYKDPTVSYSKSETDSLLNLKSDKSLTYTKLEVDNLVNSSTSNLSNSIQSQYTLKSQHDLDLDDLKTTLRSEFYNRDLLYTKTEIDSTISSITLGDNSILRSPSLSSEATIDPGSNEVVSLTLKASSNSNIEAVQKWVDTNNNLIGEVKKSWDVDFYGKLTIAKNISSFIAGLSLTNRRIENLADPIYVKDAVNKYYLQNYVSNTIQTQSIEALPQELYTSSNPVFKSSFLDYLQINDQEDLLNIPTTTPGVFYWDNKESTVDLAVSNEITYKLGQSEHIIARNTSGGPISKGEAVRFTGSIGNSGRITVDKMVADGSYPNYVFLGVAQENINNGSEGSIITFGKMYNVDTSNYPGTGGEGSILWCDPTTPGGLTYDEPSAPNLKLPVGIVVTEANNGTLLIRAGSAGGSGSFGDLSDVEISSKNDKDILYWDNSDSRWESKAINTLLNEVTGINIVSPGEIQGPSTIVIDPATVGDNTGTLEVKGDLQINGSILGQVKVQNLTVELATGASNIAGTNGAGIEVPVASAELTYNSSGAGSWVFNKEPYYNSSRLINASDGRVTSSFTKKLDKTTISGGATSQIGDTTQIQANSCTLFVVNISSRDGSSNFASFSRRFVINREGNTAPTISTPEVIGSDLGSENGSPPSGWEVYFDFINTNELRVRGKGNADWSGDIFYNEVV